MDGIPAVDLWDLVVDVLHSSKHIPARGNPWRDRKPKVNTPTPWWRITATEMILKFSMWIMSSQTQNFFTSKLCFTFFELTCRTHIFLLHSLSAHIRTSSCVSHTRMAQVPEKVHRTCVIPLHLAFSLLMIHPCLPFPHGHFETTPDYDFTDSDIHKFLPCFPVLKAQDMRHSAHASRSLAIWPNQMPIREVRRWDACPEPTQSRLIGCLTE